MGIVSFVVSASKPSARGGVVSVSRAAVHPTMSMEYLAEEGSQSLEAVHDTSAASRHSTSPTTHITLLMVTMILHCIVVTSIAGTTTWPLPRWLPRWYFVVHIYRIWPPLSIGPHYHWYNGQVVLSRDRCHVVAPSHPSKPELRLLCDLSLAHELTTDDDDDENWRGDGGRWRIRARLSWLFLGAERVST